MLQDAESFEPTLLTSSRRQGIPGRGDIISSTKGTKEPLCSYHFGSDATLHMVRHKEDLWAG